MIPTIKGSMPYLTPDMLEKSDAKLQDCQLSDILPQLEPFKIYISKKEDKEIGLYHDMIGQNKKKQLQMLTPCNTSGNISKGGVNINIQTEHGNTQIKDDIFIDAIYSFQPNIILLKGEETTPNDSISRIKKIQTKNSTWITNLSNKLKITKNNITYNPQIVIQIDGGIDKKCRQDDIQRYTTQIEKIKIDINGFFIGSIKSIEDNTIRKDILKLSLEILPTKSLRIVQLYGSFIEILDCISHGIDICSITKPQDITEKNIAIQIPSTLNEWKILQENKDISCFQLCLFDEKFLQDSDPIQKDCKCYACIYHTRSYVSHLINTHEILANVLLLMHNLHAYDNFFKLIRDCIKDNTLNDLYSVVNALFSID